jgi:hypothetical protein
MDGGSLENKNQIFLRRLSEEDFAGMESAWSGLLALSDADGLFMSWAWQYSWWQVWGGRLGLELLLLGVYDESQSLIGLAPFYRHSIGTPFGISFTRLQFIGNAWRLSGTVRTEYVSIIAMAGREASITKAVLAYLEGFDWDALVISDCNLSALRTFESAISEFKGISEVTRNVSYGVVVETFGSFTAWCEKLGRNTRLKAFSRRKLFLDKFAGEFRLLSDLSEKQCLEFFERLNSFQLARWGKRCFDDLAIEFHCKLLKRLSYDQNPRLSELVAGNTVISVLYDIQCGSRVYNLQSGFDERFDPRVSLGTLHFGYAIENGFQNSNIEAYDLLAGAGKNSFYKSHFRGREVTFPTIDFVRSPVLKVAYFCRSWLPKSITSRINKVFRL